MNIQTVFFVGKPGCGKGTQAKLLSDKTGWPVFGSGGQFRQMLKEDSVLGRKVKSENDAGILQPHWLAMYIYLKALFSVAEDQSVIFDGFNRKVPEAELIVDSLRWLGRSFAVLNISVSDEEVQKRLIKRKEIESRADDSVVDERLREYNEYTKPAIEVFRKAGALIEINGEQTPKEIAVDVNVALGIK